MSLAHSKAGPGQEGWELCSSRKSEKKARGLSQPNHIQDPAAYTIHTHGNTKPQEPPFLQRRPSKSKLQPRLANHIHAKPWSICNAPGRKENPHHINAYHRVWMSDAGKPGRVYDGTPDLGVDLSQPRRWNRDRKAEYNAGFEAELYALKPHDEIFAIHTNVKFWTHLKDNGMHAGGQEKLDYVPSRKEAAGRHTAPLYLGKYAGVRHEQMILKTGHKNAKNSLEEWQIDTRPMFDNRLHDDIVRYTDDKDKAHAQVAYEFLRPLNTRSCPQMGADYMHR